MEKLSPCNYDQLFIEEKVVLDAWNFDSSYCNGMDDLVANENYDAIAKAFWAMRTLGPPRLREFVATMEGAFKGSGISCESGDSIAKVEELSDSQRKRLSTELAIAERPYPKEFWDDGVLTLATKDYLISKLEVFKRRKQQGEQDKPSQRLNL